MGTIMVSQGSVINTSGDRAGAVVIRGGQLTLEGSSIFADTFGATAGPVDEPSDRRRRRSRFDVSTEWVANFRCNLRFCGRRRYQIIGQSEF